MVGCYSVWRGRGYFLSQERPCTRDTACNTSNTSSVKGTIPLSLRIGLGPAAHPKLCLPNQTGETAARICQELLGGVHFHDLPGIHDQDTIVVNDRVQTVGNRQHLRIGVGKLRVGSGQHTRPQQRYANVVAGSLRR